MRIIFVRHGEPDYEHDCLTAKGREQAAAELDGFFGGNFAPRIGNLCIAVRLRGLVFGCGLAAGDEGKHPRGRGVISGDNSRWRSKTVSR